MVLTYASRQIFQVNLMILLSWSLLKKKKTWMILLMMSAFLLYKHSPNSIRSYFSHWFWRGQSLAFPGMSHQSKNMFCLKFHSTTSHLLCDVFRWKSLKKQCRLYWPCRDTLNEIMQGRLATICCDVGISNCLPPYHVMI